MKVQTVGIIMNGVTGRMGTNQHLMRSIVEIIKQGGVKIGEDQVMLPDPILVGRNPVKLEERSKLSGIEKWTIDLDEVLSDPHYTIYFDAQTTDRRAAVLKKAIKAGKQIYCEKPTANTAREAYEIYQLARDAGVKHGVVHDKLWLPGFLKLKQLIDDGYFGEILSIRGEFGYWVFEGDRISSQRPSWNYRKEDGGGIILDMFPHWSYVLENLFGRIEAVSCIGATHIKKRWDELGKPYTCTAEDAAYATFKLESGVIAQFNSDWVTRVRRDDLLTVHIDGTEGSAVAGLRKCWIQPYNSTPKPVWNPDIESPIDFLDSWTTVQNHEAYDNAFKVQWELFLKHVVTDIPFPYDLLSGARGVQLAEKGLASWQNQAWEDVPELKG
ncbi:MAG: Gfo/Idh/MocA family oxidoreductase [Fidelibacterota bacterium]|nr:MAG: Gfo/Idh/MocA family oxidoreductase [Candidatus Neomarinimicrobiota bacterium]